ncbi:hypothetical protein JW964_23275 [candidate division KSB1 bacterium]|nr:hypothetical protein [candidate division KSB1 bacterium]
MKSRLFWLILVHLLFLHLVNSFGSDTRVHSMGNANCLMRDYYNIFIFPASIVEYPDYVVVGFGGNQFAFQDQVAIVDKPYAGLTFGVLSRHVLGLFIDGNNEQPPFSPSLMRYHYDFFYGVHFNAFSLGFRAQHGSGVEKLSGYTGPADTNNFEKSVSVSSLTAGISLPIVNFGILDAALTYQMTGFKNEAGGIKISEPEDYNLISLDSRFIYSWGESYALIPFVSYIRNSAGQKVYQTEPDYYTEIRTENTLLFGMGFNYKPYKNLLIIGGLNFLQNQLKNEVSQPGSLTRTNRNTELYFPFIQLGFEAQLRSWFLMRMGMQKLIGNQEAEYIYMNDVLKSEVSRAAFGVSIGIGFKFKDFTLDTMLDQDYLRRGPYILSGEKGRMFPRVTATYAF